MAGLGLAAFAVGLLAVYTHLWRLPVRQIVLG